jgi:NAD(P)-dependent dehydrogenase (short-subunit alcohol dehydrogenase family)
MGVPGFLHYVASKGALLAMTRAMAAEVGDLGVRVNAVLPGFTWSEASQQAGDDYVEKQAIERVVEPEDIAGVVSFLAGPDSGVMSGQAIAADPGLTYY